jgi:predicted ATPase
MAARKAATKPRTLRDDGASLNANLTREARAAIITLADDNGVSVSTILEAWCQELAAEIAANDGDAVGIQIELLQHARQIGAQRRRRGNRLAS